MKIHAWLFSFVRSNGSGRPQRKPGALSQSRTHNEVNEITGLTTTSGTSWDDPGYDDNGNMDVMPIPGDMASTYAATWDAWNRLVKLDDGSNTIAEYEYDAIGRRIVKKIYDAGVLDETRHCYYSQQSQCLEERVDSSTDPAQQFVWGIRFVDDLILRDRDTTGNGVLDERLYSLCDPRFSVVAIADTTGSVLERFAYDAYGKLNAFSPTFSSLTSSNYDWQFTYTGRRLDFESGLYFFRARYYHAELGVFVSRDPMGYIDGMSLYRAYVVPNGNDPRGLGLCTNEADSDFDLCMGRRRIMCVVSCGGSVVNMNHWLGKKTRSINPCYAAACWICMTQYEKACEINLECNLGYCSGILTAWERWTCGGSPIFLAKPNT